ncbi:MAG: hypothetical protein WKG07_05750 [Hymenobacter sp.]
MGLDVYAEAHALAPAGARERHPEPRTGRNRQRRHHRHRAYPRRTHHAGIGLQSAPRHAGPYPLPKPGAVVSGPSLPR